MSTIARQRTLTEVVGNIRSSLNLDTERLLPHFPLPTSPVNERLVLTCTERSRSNSPAITVNRHA